MDLNQDQKKELFDLFASLREGTITPDQFKRLDTWLMENREVRLAYLDYFKLCGCLRAFQLAAYHANREMILFSPQMDTQEPIQQDFSDSALWKMMAEVERTADTVPLKDESKEPMILPARPVHIRIQKISRASLVTFISAMAALIFMVLYVYMNPRVYTEVATLVDSIDARWSQTPFGINPGTRFTINRGPVRLEKGVAKFTYDQGVDVLIEGPAQFQMTTPTEIVLKEGKLFAHVTETGAGFSVKTQNSKIIDLGTDFGVSCSQDGDTQLHVFRGKTKMIAGSNNHADAVEDVFGGYAREVSSTRKGIRTISLSRGTFVRAIDSHTRTAWRGESINLADIVAGGDGIGSKGTKDGIRWDNGQLASRKEYYVGQREKGPGKFIPTVESELIEGVFVPDGSQGPNVITKDGSIVWNAPPTCNEYCYNINVSGLISRGSGRIPEHQQILEGKLCGTPENPAISMHPNAGITFNLQAIRARYDGYPLAVFTAVCGFSQTVTQYANQFVPGYTPTTSFYVLVDGQERFSRIDMTPQDGICRIQVELNPQDRYLTLVTTEGTDGKISYGWCVFARPELIIE